MFKMWINRQLNICFFNVLNISLYLTFKQLFYGYFKESAGPSAKKKGAIEAGFTGAKESRPQGYQSGDEANTYHLSCPQTHIGRCV